jgi:hypothetical protein
MNAGGRLVWREQSEICWEEEEETGPLVNERGRVLNGRAMDDTWDLLVSEKG